MLILFEDNHLLIYNKQPGDIVQGDKTGDEPLSEQLKGYIKEKYHKPGEVFLGVVHRIDRPVSGTVVFARTSKALSRLNRMLKEGTMQKTYWAVVKQCPPTPSGKLVHYVTRNEKQNKTYVYNYEVPSGKRAELSYTLIAHSDRYYLLEVQLATGRHHQIRAQLAHIGCPIKGDLKYGYPRSNPDGSIHLHARRISFLHPVKNTPVTVEASPPDEKVWNLFHPQEQKQP
ncbi:MAG TPA: RluA family pseudouridine synthase [Bacteroidales bacterium]|nr:RluA family pseudouridine synthase [Bacteroidales bacterium]HPS73676.1 RluA family pseudouridine synthase [Bacteroidales bacterium]